jgi:hypothetical protein
VRHFCIAFAIGLVCFALADCKHRAAVTARKVEPMSPTAIVAYVQQQIAMAPRDDAGRPAELERNKSEYFGCIEKNKTDDCRFMLCSPYAIYAGDEHFQLGQFDDAFTFYAGAHELLQNEIANTTERRNEREAEFDAKTKAGKADEQDRRQFLYSRAILSHNLYRNYASLARVLERFALVFDKQGKTAEAANARTVRDGLVRSSADEYAEYFKNRQQLLPLLDPKDPKKGTNYLSVVNDMDGLLEIRHF